MKNKVIGLLFGLALASAFYIPLLYQQMEAKYELGLSNGVIEGLVHAANKIEHEFGVYEGKAKYSTLFSVKTTEVIVVTNGSEKYIKVIP
jgi:hypothetical protein